MVFPVELTHPEKNIPAQRMKIRMNIAFFMKKG
jgi:hypothetical protein